MSSSNQSGVMKLDSVVLYNDPLLVCAQGRFQNFPGLVLQTLSNDINPGPSIIFDPSFCHIENLTLPSFSNTSEISYDFEGNLSNCDQVKIFYKSIPNDQPEFVDVNNLTNSECTNDKVTSKENIISSDEESDVIFVREYKKETQDPVSLADESDSKDDGLRRNPIRSARIKKGNGFLQKEHLLEEDFAFLDEFDEDNLVLSKSYLDANLSAKELYKEWPVNVFERPEYNPETNKIEPFDYTIRNIQSKQVQKKPRLETCMKPKKKTKKKYVITKRRHRKKKVVEKVAIAELKEVVSATFGIVSEFVKIKEDEHVPDNKMYTLLKTQAALLAVVNNFDETDVRNCVLKLSNRI